VPPLGSRLAGQVIARVVQGELRVGAQADQRGFAHLHLVERDLVLALADIQQHFHPLRPAVDKAAHGRCQVAGVNALMARNLADQVAQLDLIALGRDFIKPLALPHGRRTGDHRHIARHDHGYQDGRDHRRDGGHHAFGLNAHFDVIGRRKLKLGPAVRLDDLAIDGDAHRRRLAGLVAGRDGFQPGSQGHAPVGFVHLKGRAVELIGEYADHGNK